MAQFNMPNAHLERRVTSFSYILPADPIFPLTFRDKNGFPETFKGMDTFGLGREMPDTRIWQNVAVETSPAVPLNVLFDHFASTLDPFCSYAGKTSAEIQEITRRLSEVSPGRFVQGQVKDLPIADDHTVYYNRSSFGPFAAPDLTMKQPKERTLPPSCIAPKHWIRPSMPPGGDAVWECLPSLAFVGSGHELYPGATSPPAIASHVYVPRSFERLGIYPHAAYRLEVTKDCTPMKLEPPLTAAQAHALLGRAIQYEVPAVPLPPLPEGARPKKKRREDPPAVYWGVVWGVNDVDPAALELRIFTGGQYHEACATLTVGEPCAVPTNRIDPSRPFTPKWVGALALVDEPEAPEEVSVEPPAPPVEVQDRLASILKIAAKSPQFEVGIDGDCTILAGEIALHGVQESDNSFFTFIQEIENCKPGIWQGGRDTDGDEFVIWVCWVREGSIDLTQPVENFVVEPQGGVDIEALAWTEVSTVSVDGGTMSILTRGVTSLEAIQALTGNDDGDVEGFVECIVLHGAEEDSFHIPGGVSSYTGGDGGFRVYAAPDSDGKVVGVKVVGS
ncbi:hypothetical protein B0H14DRAFT_2661372 [Mycena olivaceomarginata]|nr:hypothetical protein B0H14DRAFT_2661372 [Mycena olivaceomarginata]